MIHKNTNMKLKIKDIGSYLRGFVVEGVVIIVWSVDVSISVAFVTVTVVSGIAVDVPETVEP